MRPGLFGSLVEFGMRYCDPQLPRFGVGVAGTGMDFRGATEATSGELYDVMRAAIMVRGIVWKSFNVIVIVPHASLVSWFGRPQRDSFSMFTAQYLPILSTPSAGPPAEGRRADAAAAQDAERHQGERRAGGPSFRGGGRTSLLFNLICFYFLSTTAGKKLASVEGQSFFLSLKKIFLLVFFFPVHHSA